MKKIVGAIVIVLLALNVSYAQRYAVLDGNWNGSIWADTPGGVAGSAATPTATDDVYTNGFLVTVSGSVSCNNLNIRADVSNSLDIGDNIVTINGQLSGVNSSGAAAFPTVSDALIMTDFGELVFVGSGQKINRWRYENGLTNVTFNPGFSLTATILSGIRIENFGILTISSGNLSVSASNSREIRGCSDCTLNILSGATLNTSAAINGGGTTTTQFSGEESTRFGNLSISGSLISTNYVNTVNLTVGSTGVFQTSYNGVNQTEGWWYQSNRPTGGTIAQYGSVSFNASADQNIYARNYGNLTIDGSGTKSVVGGGTFNMTGLLTVNSGTFTSPTQITFNGPGYQNISGAGTININNGIVVNKSAGSVDVNKALTINGDIQLISGGFFVFSQTLTLNGNIINNSLTNTVSFGTGPNLGTLVINGSTVISGSVYTELGNVIVNGGGSLTSSGTVRITGDVSNSGTLAMSTIIFYGNSPQSITGSMGVTTIYVDPGTNISNNGNISLTGTLYMVGNGVFDADGTTNGVLRLVSSGLSFTARIAPLPDPINFTGNVTIERYIDAPEGWRYFSMPLATLNNVGQFKDDIAVTGNFSDRTLPAENPNVLSSTAASIYRWDGPTQAWTAIGSGASTSATALSNSVGYSAWTYVAADQVIDFRGDIVKGPKALTLSNGYNLIPNPYPSAIDWDNIVLTGANLTSNTMYVRTGNGVFATYVQTFGVGTGHPGPSWNGEAALGQAFWVQSTGGTLTMTEAAKTTYPYQYVRTETPENYIRVRLKGNNQEDDILVRFHEDATVGTDVELDGLKKKNGDYSLNLQRQTYINLSSYSEEPTAQYAINSIPLLECEYALSLSVEDTPVGSYSFEFEDLDQLSLGYTITLYDAFLDKNKLVEQGSAYTFEITEDVNSWGHNRFQLKFSEPVPSIIVEGNVLSSSATKGNQWYKDGLPLAGEEGDQLVVTASGVYSLKVSTGTCELFSDEIPFIITAIDEQFLAGIKVYPNPVKDQLTISIPTEVVPKIRNLAIFDLKGGEVVSMNDSDIKRNGDVEIDFSTQQNGLYLLKISTERKVYTLKVVKY